MCERQEFLNIFRKYVHDQNFNHYIEYKLAGDFICKLLPLLKYRGYNDVESINVFSRMHTELSK